MHTSKNFNPVFIEKTKNGEVMYDISSRLLKDRVIYLDGEIDDEVASQITSLLFLLDREDSENLIKLWISSPGGSAYGMFSIYDMIQRIKAPVRTICIGFAASAGAVLLCAGTPGERYALPNSRIMIHQLQLSGIGGSNAEVEVDTKESKKLQNNMLDILSKHTGNTKAKIKRDIKFDKYLSAEEAKAYGIIDNILTPSKE